MRSIEIYCFILKVTGDTYHQTICLSSLFRIKWTFTFNLTKVFVIWLPNDQYFFFRWQFLNLLYDDVYQCCSPLTALSTIKVPANENRSFVTAMVSLYKNVTKRRPNGQPTQKFMSRTPFLPDFLSAGCNVRGILRERVLLLTPPGCGKMV